MFKHIILTGILLAALTGGAIHAQEHAHVNYAPGRAELAEQTFKELVKTVGGITALEIASDLEDCKAAIKDEPDLLTAVYENIIFDYCKIPDEMKTYENRRASELDGKKYFTLKKRDDWVALGKEYIQKRNEIEDKQKKQ